MGVEAYSTNPDDNNARMPEGQLPSTVNNGVRQVEADIAGWYNDQGWYRPGAPAPTITRVSANVFRVPGLNVTSLYPFARRVRAQGDLTGTIYGDVSSSTFTGGNTDVTVEWDSSGLAADTSIVVSIGILTGFSSGAAWAPFATASSRGIVRIANNTEVAALSETTLAISPSGLGALDATTAQRGIVQLSTATQVREANNSTTAIPPVALGGANVESADPGFIRYAKGVTLNFGSGIADGSGVASITYPQNYTSHSHPVATARNATHANVTITAKSNTGFSVLITNASGVAIASCPFDWQAWGL